MNRPWALWCTGVVVASVALGLFIRTQSLRLLGEAGVLSVDGHRQVRQAEVMTDGDPLAVVDSMRSAPLGKPYATQSLLHPRLLSTALAVGKLARPALTIERVAVYYPVVAFAIAACLYLSLVARLTDIATGVLSLLAFSVAPSVAHRTTAGFADRDGLVLVLFLATLDVVSRSWGSPRFGRSVAWAGLSGVLSGLLGLAWVGAGMLSAILCGVTVLHALTNRLSARRCWLYAAWCGPAVVVMATSPTFHRVPSAPHTLLAIGAPCPVLLYVGLYAAARFGRLGGIVAHARERAGVYAAGTCVAAGLVLLLGVVGPSEVVSIARDAANHFFYPLGRTRLMLSVAEMRPTFLIGWWDKSGLLFFVALAGAGLVFARAVGPFVSDVWLALSAFMILQIGAVFSTFSSAPPFNGDTAFARATYLGSTVLFAAAIVWLWAGRKASGGGPRSKKNPRWTVGLRCCLCGISGRSSSRGRRIASTSSMRP